MELILIRISQSDQGTKGVLLINNTFFCYTLELPWNNNIQNYSCIPPGTYNYDRWLFHRTIKSYHILSVPNRNYVLIHSGNYAGDPRKGYKTHVEGCILVGKYFGILDNQQAILCSRQILHKLIELTRWKSGIIHIKDTDMSKYGQEYYHVNTTNQPTIKFNRL
jgi:hypothetical protein